MKQTTRYLGVESVKYEFDQFDIRRALFASTKLAEYKQGRKDIFDWWEDDNGKLFASITLRYEEEKDAPNPTKG